MMDSVRQFILRLIEKKDKLPKNVDVDSFIESSEFKTIGGLVSIISRKMVSGDKE